MEVEAVAPQEVIAPMAEETAIAEETSDKEPVQESLPIEIHITSQHHQKRKASYEEMQKQEMEQRVRMVMEYIHYIMPRIADQETINYICKTRNYLPSILISNHLFSFDISEAPLSMLVPFHQSSGRANPRNAPRDSSRGYVPVRAVARSLSDAWEEVPDNRKG